MRPVVSPKFIRVKDEPEAAATRSLGVGTVLYAGAWSTYTQPGDASAQSQGITFNSLSDDTLVRFNYVATIDGAYNTGNTECRLLMDALEDPLYSSISTYSFLDTNDNRLTMIFAGTAYVPAGTHTIQGSFSTSFSTTSYISESWSVDVLNPTTNALYSVTADGGDVDLGESFEWVVLGGNL